MQDPTTPLADVTFVVIDLETTGVSPTECEITEIGALKLRGGELIGTFETLIDPRVDIPTEITGITGIDDSMVWGAPTIGAVLPMLLEFVRDAVIVGHNVRFDLGFLHADLAALDYLPIANGFADTLSLARRLVRDEVDNCKLTTLAAHFRTTDNPCHRAFADAAATADVFHALLERAGSLGVCYLDDLFAFSTTGGHPDVAKLRWVGPLPRTPGVYALRGLDHDVLYVAAEPDLRVGVRTLFEKVTRTKAGAALRIAHSFDHELCATEEEAGALAAELLLLQHHRFNRQPRKTRRPAPAA